VARLLCISVMRIIGKSFATNYVGDMHERLDTSDELGFDAVNQRVWGSQRSSIHGDSSRRGRAEGHQARAAAIGKSPVIMAFGEALSGDDIGDLIAFMSSAVALQLEKAPVPALPRAFLGFCPLLGPYRRVRRRCRRPGTPLLWPAGRHGRDG
jgi:hypothetical protein